MNRCAFAASVLSTAVGLALTVQALPAQAQDDVPQIVKDNMAGIEREKLEKCYGMNVLLPAGVCDKIEGGSLTSS